MLGSYHWLVSAQAQLGDAKAVLSSLAEMERNGCSAGEQLHEIWREHALRSVASDVMRRNGNDGEACEYHRRRKICPRLDPSAARDGRG